MKKGHWHWHWHWHVGEGTDWQTDRWGFTSVPPSLQITTLSLHISQCQTNTGPHLIIWVFKSKLPNFIWLPSDWFPHTPFSLPPLCEAPWIHKRLLLVSCSVSFVVVVAICLVWLEGDPKKQKKHSLSLSPFKNVLRPPFDQCLKVICLN